MFDIGGWEFLLIIVIAIIVIGPKDIPGTIRTVTGWIRRARELARDFQSGLDDLAQQAELDSVKNDIQSGLGLDEVRDAGNAFRAEIEHSIDPGGEIADSFRKNPVPNPYEEDDEGPEMPRIGEDAASSEGPGPASGSDKPAEQAADADGQAPTDDGKKA